MTKTDDKKRKLTRMAPVAASCVALLLVVIKFTVGVLSGAMVLIASAVDSGLDFLISVFNYFAIRKAEKPSDDKFNYGRGKIKAIASVLESLIIAGSGVFIVVSSVRRFWAPEAISHETAAVLVMIVSSLLTGGLVLYLDRVVAETDDMVVRADALHYKVDLWSNLGVLATLVVIWGTGWLWVDSVVSIVIAIAILHAAFKLMREGVLILLDRALDTDLVDKIVEILSTTSERVTGHHMLKTRRSAQIYFVEFHLVFDRHISLLDAHRISEKIERKIKALGDYQWMINTHLDPEDDYRRDLKKQPI